MWLLTIVQIHRQPGVSFLFSYFLLKIYSFLLYEHWCFPCLYVCERMPGLLELFVMWVLGLEPGYSRDSLNLSFFLLNFMCTDVLPQCMYERVGNPRTGII